MSLFEMHYVDKKGNPTNIDGNGIWKFKHGILTIILFAIILPPLFIIAFICRVIKPLN